MQTVKYCAAQGAVLLFLTGCGPAPREAVGPHDLRARTPGLQVKDPGCLTSERPVAAEGASDG